jgi:glycosyltransferase involved in cell wall biosynthesis
MSDMNVTVIIRTLNEEHNIGKCLEALTLQSMQAKEIIITDNMSSDNTLDVIKDFRKLLPIRLLNNPIIGFASGLNLGVANSEYDHVAFLSADCIPNKDWLLNLVRFMNEENCAVVQGVEIFPPTNLIHYVLSMEQKPFVDSEKLRYFNCTNTLFNKHILEQFLPFEYVGPYLYGEDTLMSLEYFKRGYEAYAINSAYVNHNKFDNVKDFKKRVFKHNETSINLILIAPLKPRIYLNSYYWTSMELFLFIRKRDIRFLKVSYWRFVSAIKGQYCGSYNLVKLNIKNILHIYS